MKIIPVTDPAFAPYGRVVEGYPVAGLLKALEEKNSSRRKYYLLKIRFSQIHSKYVYL